MKEFLGDISIHYACSPLENLSPVILFTSYSEWNGNKFRCGDEARVFISNVAVFAIRNGLFFYFVRAVTTILKIYN